ncbi:MAG: twin-arginine translocase TatA/TatE family subunit [Nitrolancea sp.]
MIEGLFQPIHLLIILAIILIVFGAGKLPEVGGGLGKSITEFRKGVKDATSPDEPVAENAKPIAAAKPVTVAKSVEAAGSFCPTCGAKVTSDARFCASCGAKQAA